MSQTPLTQVSAPAPAVHVPLSVGAVCGGSLGTGAPFASFGVQVWVLSWHQLPPAQSASTSQPPSGSQTPLTLHAVERQTTGPVGPVQGPSPVA